MGRYRGDVVSTPSWPSRPTLTLTLALALALTSTLALTLTLTLTLPLALALALYTEQGSQAAEERRQLAEGQSKLEGGVGRQIEAVQGELLGQAEQAREIREIYRRCRGDVGEI